MLANDDKSFLDFLDTLPDATSLPDTVRVKSTPYSEPVEKPNHKFDPMVEKRKMMTEKERMGLAVIESKLSNATSRTEKNEILELAGYRKRYGHTAATGYTLEKYRQLEKEYRKVKLSPPGRKQTWSDRKLGLSKNF
jgi:Ni/Co efflux regulator RcnB